MTLDPLHPRHVPFTQARATIISAVNQAACDYDCTYAEVFAVLGELVGRFGQRVVNLEQEPGSPPGRRAQQLEG